jgi:hypothetical protein
MVVGEAEGADCRQAEEAKTRKTRRRTDCKRGKQRKRHRIHRTPLVYILPPLLEPPRKINAILARLLQIHSWAISQLLPCRSMTQLPKSLGPTSLPAFVPDCVPHEAPEAQCLDLTVTSVPKLPYVPGRVTVESFHLAVGFKTPNWAHTGYMSEKESPLCDRHHFRQRIRAREQRSLALVLAMGAAGAKVIQSKVNLGVGTTVEEMAGVKKETGRGSLVGYEVTGWRHMDTASWHIKVWPAGRPSDWIGYTVTDGEFELKMLAVPQKEAVLRLIRQWETEFSNSTA